MSSLSKTTNEPDEYFINGKKFKLFIKEEQILSTVEKIAEQINKDYSSKKPVILVILKGAMFFAVDLIRKLSIECELQVASAKSYGYSMHSNGNVLVKDFDFEVKNRDIIVIEDIVDTGFTVKAVTDKLNTLNPASLKIAAIFLKPDKLQVEVKIDYLGIKLPPAFVVGYGLDYAECGRHLKNLYALEE